jgi:glycosyltransferase involved in cell wall biosynthesis
MVTPKRIGFVSTRLAGTDGVSLETEKWAIVLERNGHTCTYMAGELDTPEERSFLVPECHFTHPEVLETYHGCFGRRTRDPGVTRQIEALKHRLKDALVEFMDRFELDLLIPENALTIPLNIPLGLALTECAAETGMPMIAHHHDFFWERKRFLQNACWDYLNKAFPPHLPMIQHTVINSSQDNQVSLRTGISTMIIPNVMDFEVPPPCPDGYADDLRDALGFADGEAFILQPTRVVQRKGIERAVELVHRLGLPAKLVISHASGDEGDEYAVRIREYSRIMGVETVSAAHLVGETRGTDASGRKLYTLEDFYHVCDFVTYPSRIEGFGNAFLEAIYYRRPVLVNNYAIFDSDIAPKGFRTVEINEYVTKEDVEQVRTLLRDPDAVAAMVDHNYDLGRRFFSFDVLAQKLNVMLAGCFGA